jgi:hypothetical protein
MSIAGCFLGSAAIIGLFLILIPLVLIHEFGHFIMARLAGIRVLEFGLGFPPRAKDARPRPRDRVHAQLPADRRLRSARGRGDGLGRSAGLHQRTALPKQLIVLVAGVAMNLLVAVFLFFVVAWAFNPVVQPTIAVGPGQLAGGRRRPPVGRLDRLDRRPTYPSRPFWSSRTPTSRSPWRQDLLSHAGQTVISWSPTRPARSAPSP